MQFERLLAKSSTSPYNPLAGETLPGHLADVGSAASQLVAARAASVLHAHAFLPEQWQDDLQSAVLRGALLHDIGKANDHFQVMVRSRGRVRQSLRHETVGLVMLADTPALNQWFFDGVPERVRMSAIRSMIGHHLKFGPSSLEPIPSGRATLSLLMDHPDFQLSLSAMSTAVKAQVETPRLTETVIELSKPLSSSEGLVREVFCWWHYADEETRRFAAAVAALVIAADVSASILARMTPATRLVERVSVGCTAGELEQAARRRLRGSHARPFQNEVAAAGDGTTLVTAGCGTGKTVAAWLWAASRLAGKKLFFCYPTTGTASEGFLDYAWPEFEEDAALVHSRAELDIERLLFNGDEEAADRMLEGSIRHQGLQVWGAKATVVPLMRFSDSCKATGLASLATLHLLMLASSSTRSTFTTTVCLALFCGS